MDTALLDILAPLLALLPEWLATVLTHAALACMAASALTNILPTPPTPGPDASWLARALWWGYRALELAALIGRRAKERPDEAAALLELAKRLPKPGADAPALANATPSVVGALLDVAARLRR